jgi:hypothetical protein
VAVGPFEVDSPPRYDVIAGRLEDELAFGVGHVGRVVAGEACRAEPVARRPGARDETLDRQIADRVDLQEVGDLLHRHPGGQQRLWSEVSIP